MELLATQDGGLIICQTYLLLVRIRSSTAPFPQRTGLFHALIMWSGPSNDISTPMHRYLGITALVVSYLEVCPQHASVIEVAHGYLIFVDGLIT